GYFPDVKADSAGNFVVVWTGYNEYGNFSYNVHGRRYSSNGSALGAAFRVNTYTVSYVGHPQVAWNGPGFVVVWEERNGDASGKAVLAKRYASDGSAFGSAFLVNSTTIGDQNAQAVAAGPGGSYVVVWTSAQIPGAMHDIFGQRYCLNGDANGDGVRDI